MSGDLMHKGLMELCEATADTVTLDDYIPIYQKRTLQVMKIKVGALIDAMAKLYDTLLEEEAETPVKNVEEEAETPVKNVEEEAETPVKNVEEEAETPVKNVEEEAETPAENVEEEIKKPTKTRRKNKTKKENE